MLSQDFCYYLQGFAELTDKPPTKEQWAIIKSKLESVFHKTTPDRSKLGSLADIEYVRIAPGTNGKPPEKLIEITGIGPVAYCAGAGESPLTNGTKCGQPIHPSFGNPLAPGEPYRSC